MKKVIFSAIAMIAFVGSSIASNGVDTSITELAPPLTKSQCDSAYKATVLYYRNHGSTKAQAESYAKAGRDACYKDNGIKVSEIQP